MDKKILLIGEASSVHRNLTIGLAKIGYEATDVSYGNAGRLIQSKISLQKKIPFLSQRISENINPFLQLKNFKDYDIVQFIQYANNFNPRFGIDKYLTEFLLNSADRKYLIATTCDPIVRNFFKEGYKYNQICKECLKHDFKSTACVFDGEANMRKILNFVGKVDGIIPSVYEYAEAYRQQGIEKILPMIPYPIDLDTVEYKENLAKGKMKFFHGLNKWGFKGTEIISKAMDRLKSNYPNDVECSIVGNVSLGDYIKLLGEANVIVDQAYSATYGMNGAYAMALGKVVVGGGQDIALHEMGLNSSPIIKLIPTEQGIYDSLEYVLANKTKITDMGSSSRQFVEENHDDKKIARRYVDVWGL